MKAHHFFPVFLALIASYIGLHFYVARWLAKAFGFGQQAAWALRLVFLAAAFLSPLTLFLRRHYQGPSLDMVYTAVYAWMGVILIAAFIFFCFDLGSLALSRFAPGALRFVPWAALTTLALVLASSSYQACKIPGIKEITVTFSNLPPALDGFKIAQISDMHIDSAWKLKQYAGVVDRIDREKPDLVLFTGDLIDPGITCRQALRDITGKLKSRLGVYGALGNHEYYYGLDKSVRCYGNFGIKLLHNEGADLKELRLFGFGDIHTEGLGPDKVKELLAKDRDGKFTVIMSHQPVYYREIADAGEYLVLSGHTHRGQIFPFHIFTWLFYHYFYGLYRIKDSAFYVTSGEGTWGPPLRWFAPAEIPIITLKARK
jgi:predicted MPP superfamily phosphohydrolase